LQEKEQTSTSQQKNILLNQAGGIISSALLSGSGGDINVKASDFIQLSSFSPFDPLFGISTISTLATGLSSGGKISVETPNLQLEQGGSIFTSVFGSGQSGDVLVKSKSIQVSGNNPISLTPTVVGTVGFSGLGNAGGVDIDTERLTLLDGGNVASSTQDDGRAGNVNVTASDYVKVLGTVSGSIPGVSYPSQIISSGNKVDPQVQQLLGLPPQPSGNSGNVDIHTNRLTIADGGQVTVKNEGAGEAGTLTTNSSKVILENKGGLSASTASGDGGNIQLNIKDLLLLQGGSSITASALGLGTGGNITIDPDLVVLLEGSRISADAQQGLGGRVDITAKGLFYPPGSITAKSALGPQFNGTVQVNTPDTDFAKATTLTAPPQQAPEITSVCQRGSGSTPGQFVKVGTGGILPKPGDLLHSSAGWQDQPPRSTAAAVQAAVLDDDDDPDVQGVIFHPDGTLNFISQPGVFYSPSSTLPCKSSTVRK